MLSGPLTFERVVMSLSSSEQRNDVRKAVAGASIGNAVEWFDFAIYGFLATFIAANFFPSGNETAALLNTFAIFAAAFFMRPLGGFVFGPLGDFQARLRHPGRIRQGQVPLVLERLCRSDLDLPRPALRVVVEGLLAAAGRSQGRSPFWRRGYARRGPR